MRILLLTFLILDLLALAETSRAQLAILNQYWFTDKTTQKTLWLFGHGITNLISQTQVDPVEHNRHYSSYGANTLRLHLTQGALGPGSPWMQLDSGLYDLEKWNALYWKRLDQFMQDCQKRGIYPFIQIWDEPVIERGATRWRLHPFRPSNNINDLHELNDDPEGHGMEGFYNIRNDKLMYLQRIFVQRVLDYTAHYGICIYSICNEYDYGEKAPQQWQQYWIDFLRRYEQKHRGLAAPLLFTNTAVKKYLDSGFKFFPLIDWYYLGRDFRLKNFSRDGEDLVGTDPDVLASLVRRVRRLYPGKILINSRPSSSPDRGRKDFTNEEQSRRIAWCFFMSAVHIAGFRHLSPEDKSDTRPWLHPDRDCIECTDGLATERVLNSVHAFLRIAKPNLAEMVPQADLQGDFPVLKLTSPGELILYLPEGGKVKVENLELYEKIFRYDPLHPERGLLKLSPGESTEGFLVAPGAETVFFLRRKAASNPGF